jgi:hypothetical protein
MKKDIKEMMSNKTKIKENMGRLIYDCEDPTRITAIVKMYADTQRELSDLNYLLYNMDKNIKQITTNLDSIGL